MLRLVQCHKLFKVPSFDSCEPFVTTIHLYNLICIAKESEYEKRILGKVLRKGKTFVKKHRK